MPILSAAAICRTDLWTFLVSSTIGTTETCEECRWLGYRSGFDQSLHEDMCAESRNITVIYDLAASSGREAVVDFGIAVCRTTSTSMSLHRRARSPHLQLLGRRPSAPPLVSRVYLNLTSHAHSIAQGQRACNRSGTFCVECLLCYRQGLLIALTQPCPSKISSQQA